MTPDEHELELAEALRAKANSLDELGRHDEELVVYDETIRRFGGAEDERLRVAVVRALRNKGITLADRGEHTAALQVYEEAVTRYGADTPPAMREQVAWTLAQQARALMQLDRHADAVAVYDQILRDCPADLRVRRAWALANQAGALGALGRWEEALACCDEVLDGDRDAPLREPRSRAFRERIDALLALGRSAEALAGCDALLAAPDASDTDASVALMGKVEALEVLNRPAEALATCDAHLARFADSEDDELREWSGLALLRRAALLWDLEQPDASLDAYAEITRRFTASRDVYLAGRAADAGSERARRLIDLGRYAEAIAAADAVIDEPANEAAAADTVDEALRWKTVALGELGRFAEAANLARALRHRHLIGGNVAAAVQAARTQAWALRSDDRLEEALALYADALAGTADNDDLDLLRVAAWATLDHTEALVAAGRADDALAILDELIETEGAIEDAGLREAIAHALNAKAGLLLLSGDATGEALVVLRSLVDRLDPASESQRAIRGPAMMNLGQGLAMAERYAEALDVFGAFVDEFETDSDPVTRRQVALALSTISEILGGAMGRPADAAEAMDRLVDDFAHEALAAYDAAATQGAQSLEPQRRMQRAAALFKKAALLQRLGRDAEAIAVVDEIDAEYDGDAHPGIREARAAALELRSDLGDG